MDIEKAHNDTSKLASGIDSIFQTVMEKLEPDMIRLNKKQLLKGKKADGSDMPEYANNPEYLRKKRQIGSKSLPNMDFKLTGDFHRSFKARTDEIGTNIFATDRKTDRLYGIVPSKELHGVTDENLQELQEKAQPILEREIRKALRI